MTHNRIDYAKLILGYGLGPLSNLIVAIYLSKFLDKESYATFMTFISFILVVFGFNAKSAIQRKLDLNYAKTINIQKWINLSWFVILIPLTYVFFPRPNVVLLLSIWFHCSAELVLERLRYDLSLDRYLFWRFLKIFLDVLLFISINQVKTLVESRSISLLMSSALLHIFLFKYVLPNTINFSLLDVKKHLKLGVGMLIYSTLMIIFTLSDRLVMDYYGTESYYLYFLMSSVGSIHMMVGSSLAPYFMFRELNNSIKKTEASWVLPSLHLLIYIGSTVVLAIFSYNRFVHLGNHWFLYLSILSLAGYFQALYIKKVQIFIGRSAYRVLVVIIAPIVLLSLVGNLLLIPVFGVVSSALILLVGSLIMFFILSLRLSLE